MDDDPRLESVHVQFWKKLELASEGEPCDECLAKPVCKLRDTIHKVKVEGKDKTIIEKCSLMVQ
jgi:hypothetical protein